MMIDHVMKDDYDRFDINRWTGYVAMSDGIIGSFCMLYSNLVPIIVGLIMPIIGKKIAIYVSTFYIVAAYSLLCVIFFEKVNSFNNRIEKLWI